MKGDMVSSLNSADGTSASGKPALVIVRIRERKLR